LHGAGCHLPYRNGPDHDCHARSDLPLLGQSQRAHLDHLRPPGIARPRPSEAEQSSAR
jgi:hypothetical protein